MLATFGGAGAGFVDVVRATTGLYILTLLPTTDCPGDDLGAIVSCFKGAPIDFSTSARGGPPI